ncbi:hypothetical protein LLG96_02290 [bacterium]|nr:hypothetical protein [bacterium]
MACVNPDGTLSGTAKALLGILDKPLTPEEISAKMGAPLFKVRSSLREMAGAGFVAESNGAYTVTEAGRAKL